MTTTTFGTLGVPADLCAVLAQRDITIPTPIQAATLPDSLAGRDVLGRGRTGSGKTYAFLLPLVARLASAGTRRTPKRPRALILAPTRELALQIDEALAPLAASAGLTSRTVFGGVNQKQQVAALARGVDVVVACPGRLEDLIAQGAVSMAGVEVTILDEADHMADLGFLPGVKRIMDKTPSRGQRMLFSATLDNGVDQLVKRYLTDPLTHSVDSAESPVVQMTHHVLAVADAETKRLVVNELASGTGRRLLFMRTKHQAKKLAKQLTAAGIPAVDLHGNLSQPARERNLAAFTCGDVKVLVATDIAARGIHVADIELVVHVDPPAEHKAYLHRSGRTARAGSAGDVVTVMLPEQAGDVRTLTRQAKIDVRPQQVRPGSRVVAELVGEIAPYVTPVVAAEPEQARGRRGGAPRSTGQRSAAPRTSRGAGRETSVRGNDRTGAATAGSAAGGYGSGSRRTGAGGPTSAPRTGETPRGGAPRGAGAPRRGGAPRTGAAGARVPVSSGGASRGAGASQRNGGVEMSRNASAGRRGR